MTMKVSLSTKCEIVMKYAYVIGDYDEHSLEHAMFTSDRDRVRDLVTLWYSTYRKNSNDLEDVLKRFDELFLKPDTELVLSDRYSLEHGWGGLVVYVISEQFQ